MPPRNLLIIAVTAIVSLACYSVASKNRYANLFAEAMEVVNQKALQDVPREKLFVSAMNGMMKGLDAHSAYIDGARYKQLNEDIEQEFGGVGMYVETDPKTKRLFVLAPMPGTPAFEAGLRPGDQILTIEGEDVIGNDQEDSIDLLRGPIGKPVEIKIERGGDQIKKTLVREAIPVSSVHGDYRRPDGKWVFSLEGQPRIGYIRLSRFGEKSSEEVENALSSISGKIDGLVLDLRNNSGGLLYAAVDICEMFLPPDRLIVETRSRYANEKYYSQSEPTVDPSLPVCVLINRNSASASEIVAGCLQDHGRVILVGEQSWGKGTVQNIIPIQRRTSALKLTIASYWRPSGKHIDRFDEISLETKIWGVHPNEGYAVEQSEQQVFFNSRQRNIRDIQGLMSDTESELISNIRAFRSEQEPSPSQQPSENASVPSPEKEPLDTEVDNSTFDSESHVDLPLQRAIEGIESLLQRNRIAA